MQPNLVYSPEVETALKSGTGVVALESTIITHGMPYPKNFETAIAVEQVVRDNGAVPATIAVINGVIRIGLSSLEIEQLAKNSSQAVKISRRDIAKVIASKQTGSTTVAANMIFAHMAKIPVFATGGIGGVHRGAESSFDISADISELARTPVLVVCAGAKSILDLPKTVELLETAGVAVIGYKTNDFPAFFSPKSLENLKTSTRCDSPQQVANIVHQQMNLGLNSGLLLTCPIPIDSHDAASTEIESATREAVAESIKEKILGKEITPFLLRRINEKTMGKSLELNIVLIKNNASIAAQVATQLAAKSKHLHVRKNSSSVVKNFATTKQHPSISVIGGIIVDTIAKPHDPETCGETRTSSPGTIKTSIGGVGRNIAQTIKQLGGNVAFHAFVGSSNSFADLAVRKEAKEKGWNLVSIPNCTTGQYLAIMNGDGTLCSGIVDMPEISNYQFLEKVDETTKICLLDTNLSEQFLLKFTRDNKEKNLFWIDCVSVAKCVRIIPSLVASSNIYLIKANLDELCALVGSLLPLPSEDERDEEKLSEWIIGAINRLKYETATKTSFLITCGKNGAFLVSAKSGKILGSPKFSTLDHMAQQITCSYMEREEMDIWRFNAPPIDQVVDCTGAGDTMFGATAWAFEEAKLVLDKAVMVGMVAARMTLMSSEAVALEISSDPQSVIGKMVSQFSRSKL